MLPKLIYKRKILKRKISNTRNCSCSSPLFLLHSHFFNTVFDFQSLVVAFPDFTNPSISHYLSLHFQLFIDSFLIFNPCNSHQLSLHFRLFIDSFLILNPCNSHQLSLHFQVFIDSFLIFNPAFPISCRCISHQSSLQLPLCLLHS